MSTEAVAGRVLVGRYELVETLGTGPMGPVWRAHDRQLRREVAIREVELPDILDDAEQAALAEKVLREASVASLLDHPGAVTVRDVVTEGGQPFVVSELVTGRTLVEVVEANGPLPVEQVAMMGIRVLDALAAAHDLGLVHRDVRPSNVLITESGIRLADFGVASMVDDPRITVHEPSYLAPEQMESAGATALSDLWSLGATLYFAVEGHPPFDEGSPAATVAAIVNQAPHPTQRAGGLQPVLDALLVKEAMDRPEDGAARALLVAAAEGRGPALVPPAPSSRPYGRQEPETPAFVGDAADVAEEPADVAEEPADVAAAPPVVETPAWAVEPPVVEEPAADARSVTDTAAADRVPADSVEWAADGSALPSQASIDDAVARNEMWAPSSTVPDDDEIWSVMPSPPAGIPAAASSVDTAIFTGPVPSTATVGSTDIVGSQETSAAEGRMSPGYTVSGDGTGQGAVRSRREPWFFQLPVETVPPPPLPEPALRAPIAGEPERPPGRFPRGLWAALLAALVASVMIALIITGGHTLRAQRPSIETSSKGPGAVSNWIPYTDETTGFTIRYPPSWSVRRTGTQTFFVDPAGVSYLEIDHQQPPAASLTASAFDQEKSFSASHPTYKRISIEPSTYQDRPASLWQFTYAEGGTNIRAIDLGVNSPKYGFALFFQARADDATRAQGTFDSFKSVFGMPN